MQTNTISHLIRQEAYRLGFMYCGFSKAGMLEEEAPRLEAWLNRGLHGEMKWMENYFDKRLDPTILVPGAKSVISLMLNYYTEDKQLDPQAPKLSKYAFGNDYHEVIKEKLRNLHNFINETVGEVGGRAFVDSAPVLDRAWAKRSGLGWIGKNANLINKQNGSFFFLAELIIDLELEYDGPVKDYCGTCTRCIDACPTGAIAEPYVIDGSRCISYLTIELKENIPASLHDKMDNWTFGCDVCQDVCPWNSFAKQHNEPAFKPLTGVLEMSSSDWYEMTEDVFRKTFKNSPVKRAKFAGIQKNLKVIKRSCSILP